MQHHHHQAAVAACLFTHQTHISLDCQPPQNTRPPRRCKPVSSGVSLCLKINKNHPQTSGDRRARRLPRRVQHNQRPALARQKWDRVCLEESEVVSRRTVTGSNSHEVEMELLSQYEGALQAPGKKKKKIAEAILDSLHCPRVNAGGPDRLRMSQGCAKEQHKLSKFCFS